jgi:hypothetical protein
MNNKYESLETRIKKMMIGEKIVNYKIGDQNVENDPDDQIVVGSLVTRNFDMSPPAQKLYSALDKSLDVNAAENAARFQDQLFALEKQVVLTQKADASDAKQAQLMYDRAMKYADKIGLGKEHSYLTKHLDFIKSKVAEPTTDTTFDGANDNRFKTPPKSLTNPDTDRDIDNVKGYLMSRSLKAQRKLKIFDGD